MAAGGGAMVMVPEEGEAVNIGAILRERRLPEEQSMALLSLRPANDHPMETSIS